MPVGKSGKYYMSPHEMRRKEGEPGAATSAAGADRPHDQEQGGEGESGDGNHHHELHEHEDGSYHSVHTHPDGHKEEAEHEDYQDASDHMDRMMGKDDGNGTEDGMEPDGDEGGGSASSDGEDMAGMYESHCK